MLREYSVQTAVADVERVLLAEHPALVFQDTVQLVPFRNPLLGFWREDQVLQCGEEVDTVGCRRRRLDQR